LLLPAAVCLPVAGQVAEEAVPEHLEEVGITQHLDAQLPLDLEFLDENGRSVRLGDYFEEDKPVLLSLIYYRCPMLCDLVLEGKVEALAAIGWTPGEQFEVLSVSIDPREKPAMGQMEKQKVIAALGDPAAALGWHFLTGTPQSIEALTETIGFRYRYLEDRQEFAHSAALYVITPQGKISRYLFGVRHDPQTLRLSLVEAAEGGIGSTVDQFLLYCYRYDATEGAYAPVAMRIMRLGAGLAAVVLAIALLGFWAREMKSRRGGDSDALAGRGAAR